MRPGLSVVMLTASFHPHVGGAEKQAQELSKALARRGLSVRIVTRRLPGTAARDTVDGIAVHRLAAHGTGLLNAAVFLAASFTWLLLHASEFDVIHVHLAGSPSLAAALAGRLTGKTVVVKIGGGRGIGEIALSSKSWAGRMKLALLALFEPRFIAVTDDLALELAEHGLGPARVIPNGVDIGRFRPPGPGEKETLRAGFGLGPGPAFLYAGRLASEKRLPEFAAVFGRAAADAAVRPQFVVAGEGPLLPALEDSARTAGVDLRLLGPQADMAPLYKACDVFVLPSLSEGLSNALLEAMASGLAVLGSRVGGTAEAVEDGVTGLLFDPVSVSAAEAPLRRLMREPGLRILLGVAGRSRVATRYSLDAVAEKTLKLYNP